MTARFKIQYLRIVSLNKRYLKKIFFNLKIFVEKSLNKLKITCLEIFKSKNQNNLTKFNVNETKSRLFVNFLVLKTLDGIFFRNESEKIIPFPNLNLDLIENDMKTLQIKTNLFYKEGFYPLNSFHETKVNTSVFLEKEKRNEIDNILRKEMIKSISLKSNQIKKLSDLKENLKPKNNSEMKNKDMNSLNNHIYAHKKILLEVNKALEILDDLFTWFGKLQKTFKYFWK